MAHNPNLLYYYKVSISGPPGSGKTSILTRLRVQRFDAEHVPTREFQVQLRRTLDDDRECTALVFDCPPIEPRMGPYVEGRRARYIPGLHVAGLHATILAFDVTNVESYGCVTLNWLSTLGSGTEEKPDIAMLVGCKIDREPDRIEVPTERSRAFAEEHGLLFAECSAATGAGVEEMLHTLLERVHAHEAERAALVHLTPPPLQRDRCF